MSYRKNISKEEMMALPVAVFDGRIAVVDTSADIHAACEDLASCPVVGFDTESRPSFKKGVINRISLLQLSTPQTCYLFRLCRIPLEKPILKILESRDILKVGLSIDGDFRELSSLRHFAARNFVDLQKMVVRYGIEDASLTKISSIVLGRRISKAQRLSNWEAVTLTEAQMQYAATDAWICPQIYNKLIETDENTDISETR